MRVTFDNIEYVIEEAKKIKQKVGRPRKRQAKYSLTLLRPNGCTRYSSFQYHDGTICKPFC